MRLVLLEPPAVEPLTSQEAKTRLNIGDEVNDATMDAYIMAARQRIDGADGYLGRALITQTWMLNFDCWPVCDGGKIRMPLPPLQQVVEISYLGADGAPVIIPPTDYQVVQGPRPYIVPTFGMGWPSATKRADAISITFIAGYGDDGAAVPEPIRTAISLGAGNLHAMSAGSLNVTEEVEEGIGSTRYAVDKTGAVDSITETAECLLSTYRIIWL
jgi:uncharacterized phiE125 gp8 family phage protein